MTLLLYSNKVKQSNVKVKLFVVHSINRQACPLFDSNKVTGYVKSKSYIKESSEIVERLPNKLQTGVGGYTLNASCFKSLALVLFRHGRRWTSVLNITRSKQKIDIYLRILSDKRMTIPIINEERREFSKRWVLKSQ